MKLYSYVMARDFGFAPNPFGGFCTLATCKPEIRKSAQVGDWVIGTGSAKRGHQGHLIYAMKVSDTLTFDDYWNSQDLQYKKPNLRGTTKQMYGDNIYRRLADNQWGQVDSHHSHHDGTQNQANIERDTKADRILISKEFAYFGSNAPEIPEVLRNFRGMDICKMGPGHKCNFPEDMIREFISWFSALASTGYAGKPLDWS